MRKKGKRYLAQQKKFSEETKNNIEKLIKETKVTRIFLNDLIKYWRTTNIKDVYLKDSDFDFYLKVFSKERKYWYLLRRYPFDTIDYICDNLVPSKEGDILLGKTRWKKK